MKKILVADDEADIRSLLKESLELENYMVYTAKNGMEAMAALKCQPDLILLDIQMAIKDGIETLKDIREMKACKDIPVIMLTSNADKRMVLESSKFNIYDYVLKPFKKRELCERIDAVLKKVSEKQPAGAVVKETRSLLGLEQEEKK